MVLSSHPRKIRISSAAWAPRDQQLLSCSPSTNQRYDNWPIRKLTGRLWRSRHTSISHRTVTRVSLARTMPVRTPFSCPPEDQPQCGKILSIRASRELAKEFRPHPVLRNFEPHESLERKRFAPPSRDVVPNLVLDAYSSHQPVLGSKSMLQVGQPSVIPPSRPLCRTRACTGLPEPPCIWQLIESELASGLPNSVLLLRKLPEKLFVHKCIAFAPAIERGFKSRSIGMRTRNSSLGILLTQAMRNASIRTIRY